MQIIDTDEDGMIVILYDSRWQYPEILGYMPGSIQYKCLRELWERITQSDDNSDDNKEDYDHDTRTERE